jgi:hypothetical protein
MGREVTYGGRGRSHSGRNGGNRGRGSQSGKPKNHTGSSKAPEMKFVPHGIGKERQTVTYNTVKEYIIQLVQKTYKNGKDVANSLRKMQKIDMTKNMPTRRLSQETGADKVMEQEGFDMLYKAEIDIYTKRKHEFEDNMNKTYSLIYLQHCSKTIQDRIMGHPEFESKIKNDPIKLLKAVEILINDPVRARYPYASVTESITRFMTCKQLENESLTDYVKRFKSNRDGLAQTMGKDFLKKFIENTREYQEEADVDKQNAMCSTAYPRWTAYMLMKNSDQGKYGSLIADDESDNSVLYGHKSVPRRHLESR